ncbi:hypothetical protein B0T10DRAFT_560600 [Thelonectria olida]|uniref:Uncharacterized protein n=1 Tax=Thelonectria olida TaxID=1576542 RepID=A0A9P9AN70_9HYPO|nr:hypothetical protein B0T10DRAFT_560600 [Thelonectria olida]
MGEGALQCIVAERSIGYCSQTDARDEVVYSAYGMCDDQPDAVEPTHTVITATLVIPTSGGVVSFPPVTTATRRFSTIPTTFIQSTTADRYTTESTTTTTTSTRHTTAKTKTETPSVTLSSFSTLPTTLVMETSSAPPFPTTSESSTTTTEPRSSTETLDLDESSTYDPMSSDITLRPTTATSPAAGETTSSDAAGAGAGKDDGNDDGLSQKQVAGISVGVLAAAGAAIGAILLARRMRKKRYPEMKSGFLPIRDTWGYKPDPSNSAGGSSWNPGPGSQRTMNPFPPRPAPAPALGTDMLSPNTIGLAISPGNSRVPSQVHTQTSTPSRRMSRLLPAKPVLPFLPLNVPGNRSPPQRESVWPRVSEQVQPMRQSRPPQLPPLQIGPTASSPATYQPPPVPKLQIPEPNLPTAAEMRNMHKRDSSMTEFEEDGRPSVSPTAQVWAPTPITGSNNTYYIADEHGNWKLGDPKHASRMSVYSQVTVAPPPLPKDSIYVPSSESSNVDTTKTLDGTASVSSVSDDSAPKRTLAPAAVIVPDRSLSSRSQKPMGPRAQPTPPPIMAPQVNDKMPANDKMRRHSSRRHSMTRNLTRNRTSAGSDMTSCTTITTSSDGTIIDPSPALEQQASLSPVQESPHSNRSRNNVVAYPIIPPKDPRRSSVPALSALSALQEIDPNKKNLAPPTSRQMVFYPPGQPSPTLGTTDPPVGPIKAPVASNWVPKPPRKPMVNPGLERTGSPTMRLVDPSPSPPETHSSDKENQSARAPPFFFAPAYPQPLNTRPSQRQRQHRYSNSTPQYPSVRPLPQPPYRQPQSQPNPRPERHSHQAYEHNWHPLRAASSQQHAQANTTLQPNPSLLAKRVGNERAAKLAIPTEANRTPWQRDERTYQAPVHDPAPGASRENRHSGPTPWVPTLTPTRRGRDLFLNVQ